MRKLEVRKEGTNMKCRQKCTYHEMYVPLDGLKWQMLCSLHSCKTLLAHLYPCIQLILIISKTKDYTGGITIDAT